MHYLGIDLGGINIAAAVVSEAGEILGRGNIPTPRGAETVADTMAAAARLAAGQAGVSWEELDAVGIGSPANASRSNIRR